jgi:hypothetical protein
MIRVISDRSVCWNISQKIINLVLLKLLKWTGQGIKNSIKKLNFTHLELLRCWKSWGREMNKRGDLDSHTIYSLSLNTEVSYIKQKDVPGRFNWAVREERSDIRIGKWSLGHKKSLRGAKHFKNESICQVRNSTKQHPEGREPYPVVSERKSC